MFNTEPPVKKLRTAGGMGFPTAAREESDPTLKRKHFIVNSVQWEKGNYRGVLQEYFQKQKQGGIQLAFDTVDKNASDPRATRIFISTCTAGDLKATGEEAGTKRKAIQLAALAAIQELKLVTDEELKSLKVSAQERKKQDPPAIKKKEKKPIIENEQYLSGNFRGALQEYLARHHPGGQLEFTTRLQESTKSRLFIAICKVVGLSGTTDEPFKDKEGTGFASSKRGAIQFSALELMMKMNLVTADAHSSIHKINSFAPKAAPVNNDDPKVPRPTITDPKASPANNARPESRFG